MFVPATVKCDVCEAPHTTTNGWFSVGVTDYAEEDSGKEQRILEVRHFEDKFAMGLGAVCGEKCLHTYLSQHLSELK